MNRTDALGVLWCDGRRSVDLPPGARVEVTRSATPVRLARTHQTPFSARLVRKFQLPIHGWRGPGPSERRSPHRTHPCHPDPVTGSLPPPGSETSQDQGDGEPSDPTNAK